MAHLPRILLLGGYGEAGKALGSLLVNQLGAEVFVAGRNFERAKEVATSLNDSSEPALAKPYELDASDLAAFRDALDGVDFFVHAGPALDPETTRGMAKRVIEAGAHWIDLHFDQRETTLLKEFDEQVRDAELCFAMQSGFHPGLPATMVRWAAGHMDVIEEALVYSFLRPRGGIPYTSGVDELVAMFADYRAKLFLDGEWKEVKGSSTKALRKFKFDFGLGSSSCFAMNLEEMEGLPEMYPSLKTTGFYIGGGDFVTNWIVSPLMMGGLKVLPGISHSRWGKLYSWSTRTFSRSPFGTCVQLAAKGIHQGEEATLGLSIVNDDAYMLTAIPAAATIAQILDGTVCKPGVHYAAHIPEPVRMMADMEILGAEVLRKTPLTEEL